MEKVNSPSGTTEYAYNPWGGQERMTLPNAAPTTYTYDDLLRLETMEHRDAGEALSERDETADVCTDKDGNPQPDPELRDYENVPLAEDTRDYFEREVRPHVPDAWINEDVRDHKDADIGKVGYEINFNRYFYRYEPPRPLEEIDADIKELEGDIMGMLREVTD